MQNTLTITEHEELRVENIRDINKKIISNEDKNLLFSIVHKDRFNKEKNVFSPKGKGVKANSIVGSISLKSGLIIEILPKFSKGNLTDKSIEQYRKTLLSMIRVSNEKNFISSTIQSSKVSKGEMPLIRYMIELFSESLLSTLRNGIFEKYNRTIENSSYIKGNVLLSKTIQNNLIDKSKVYISYNKHSSNNLLMQIFRTLSKSLLNDTNLSYRAKQNLYEIFILLDKVEIINLKSQDFKKVIFNRLNDKFEILFKQAEFIFNQYMPFTSTINSSPFWAILFDMNYLFEKFCAYLFRKSDIEFEEQTMIDCFENEDYMVRAKPDYIIHNNIVIDAKWKLLDNKKTLYGLNSQNFWQLFSYMNLISEEEINGYFIVPKNSSEFNDKIVFEPIKNIHKSISIFSIDFSLEFEDILDKYKFIIKDNRLEFDKSLKREEILINIKSEFLILKKKSKKNKKYLRGITETDFIEEYEFLTNLLSEMKNSFKTDKVFLEDILKLSNSQFSNMFIELFNDIEEGIDISIFFKYIEKNPNTTISKRKKRYESSQEWRKNF